MKKRYRFSERFLHKEGYVIDLLDEGDFIHEGVFYFDDTEGVILIPGTYHLKGWKFSNCELILPVYDEDPEDIADGYFEADWDAAIISPTAKTRVLKRGDEDDIEGTVFEDFAK